MRRSRQQRIGVAFGTVLILALAVGALSTGGVLGNPGGKTHGCGHGYGYGYVYGYGYGYGYNPGGGYGYNPGGGYGYGYGYGYGHGQDKKPGCPGEGYGYDGSGYADCETPAHGGCANPAPVYSSYDPRRTSTTYVGASNVDAFLVAHPGTFSFRAVIGLDQNPPATPPPPGSGGFKFSVLSDHFDVSVRDTDRGAYQSGGEWDPPLEVVIRVPAFAADFPNSEIAPFHISSQSATWKAIPAIPPRTTLGLDDQDGYYIEGQGAQRNVVILTRHLTTFALFRKTHAPGGNPGNGGGGNPGNGGGGGNPGNGGGNPGHGGGNPGNGGGNPGHGGGNPGNGGGPRGPRDDKPIKVSAKVGKKVTVKSNSFTVGCTIAGAAKKCAVTVLVKVGRRNVTIGTGSARIGSGSVKVRLKLNAAGRRALKKAGSRGLAATLKLTATTAQGASAEASARVKLTRSVASKRR